MSFYATLESHRPESHTLMSWAESVFVRAGRER